MTEETPRAFSDADGDPTGHSDPFDADPVVVVEGLTKVFGRKPAPALELMARGVDKDTIFQRTGLTVGVQNVSFAVQPGEIFVVMGLSGSGKSTLLRMINRLIEPTRGQIRIRGREVTEMSADELIRLRRGQVSMVFQSFALLPHLRVWENAAFGLDVAGTAGDERRQRALAVLDRVGLRTVAESFPHQLSGGMQQRVGLARALATDPRLLLMDEAFSALDPLIRAEMQDDLLELQREQKWTVIFVSHDLDEAMRIGDRIAIMEGGRVKQVGTPQEILRTPANDFVRSFFQGVDPTKVLEAGNVAHPDPTATLEHTYAVGRALELLEDSEHDHGYVRDEAGKLLGVVSVNTLQAERAADEPQLERAFLEAPRLPATAPLDSVIGLIRRSPCPAPVVDEEGRFLGVVSQVALLRVLEGEEPA